MGRTSHDTTGDGRDKPSRVAEYVAALYIALVLLSPWLLRDVSWLTPPSRGAEIQVVDRATSAAVAATERLPARMAPK